MTPRGLLTVAAAVLALAGCGGGSKPKPVATAAEVVQTLKQNDVELRGFIANGENLHTNCTAEDADGRHWTCLSTTQGVSILSFTVTCDENSCTWARQDLG